MQALRKNCIDVLHNLQTLSLFVRWVLLLVPQVYVTCDLIDLWLVQQEEEVVVIMIIIIFSYLSVGLLAHVFEGCYQ